MSNNKTYQVSIFLQNRTGHFEKVTSILREADISIRTMTLNNTTSGWGILNLLVDRPETAVEKLTAKNVSATLREIIILQMSDHSGGLDMVLKKLAQAEINFDNAYGRVVSEEVSAYLIIEVQHSEQVYSKLIDSGLVPLTPEQTYARALHKIY